MRKIINTDSTVNIECCGAVFFEVSELQLIFKYTIFLNVK